MCSLVNKSRSFDSVSDTLVQVIGYDDYIASGGEKQAKIDGKLRQEGKDYIVQDGDIIVVKFTENFKK
jgi:ribosome-binding ATPase YchF (GTP1/OBG family)